MGQQCRCKKGYCSEVDNKCSNCRTKKEQQAFLNRPMHGVNMINEFKGDYRFLSNFYMVPVLYEGILYPSSEHAYMAAKSTDPDAREFIRNCGSPAEAKKHGRNLVLRDGWETMKEHVMEIILRDKFTRNPALKVKLLATGNQELIEGNWWGDKIWGVCLKTNQGQNLLGKTLMKVREEIVAGSLPMISVVNRHHGVSGEYIGRGNPLGNPWPIDNSIGDTREIVVARYGDWLDQQILEENHTVCDELNRLADIASSTGSLSLQCFCAPLLCHGNHIKRVLIQAFKE